MAGSILLIPVFVFANESTNDHKHLEHHQEQDHHGHSENKIEKMQVSASRFGRIVTQ